MRYQHAAKGRDREIAALLSKLADGVNLCTTGKIDRATRHCATARFADLLNGQAKHVPRIEMRKKTAPGDAPDMTVADVAEYLGVNPRTVRKHDQRRRLCAIGSAAVSSGYAAVRSRLRSNRTAPSRAENETGKRCAMNS